MTTPTDTIIALEKALEAGPTQKDWLYGIRRDKSIWLSIGDREGNNGHHQGDLVALPADAQWICAANPLAIRTLLDAHASALRDAARYHWLRTRVSGVRDRHGIEEFDMPFVRPCIASIMKGSVAQHFDAAIDAQMAALDDNTKGAAPELADLGINGSRCGTHGTSGS